MEVSKSLLGVADYAIFVLMLLVSSGIGVYFRFSGGKQKTTDEYLLAGRDMSVLPVAFSLMASALSAITTIGVPAEIYMFGIHLVYLLASYSIGIVITAFLTLPVYFKLQTSSAYEYLNRRYGTLTRTIASAAFVVQMILYMSVVLYAPSLALSAVTNLSLWVSVVSIGVVCTFYSTLGGMKAVLWTDVFQALLMFFGMIAVVVEGLFDMGFNEVYERAYNGGRLVFPSTDLDLTQRYTIWNIVIQGLVWAMIAFAGNQVQIQRMLTVKKISRSRMALYLSIPMTISFQLLTCFAGITIYAYYASCDPMTAPDRPISSADQLLPYYMISTLGKYPGLPGLCICGVFSASLSTVSSAVNSLTAVTMQDFIKPFLDSRGRSLDKMAFGAKAITFFYGSLVVALTFAVAAFGNLLQASTTVYGMTGGPILAIFLLGMSTTRSNEKGVIIGLLAGVALSAWIGFGAAANGPRPQRLPVSIEGCSFPNSTLNEILNTSSSHGPQLEFTSLNSTLTTNTMGNQEDIFTLYRISYMWFSPIGLIVTMIIAYVSSLVINLLKGETEEVPYELISPVVKYFWKTKRIPKEEKEIKNEFPLELQYRNESKTIGVKGDDEKGVLNT